MQIIITIYLGSHLGMWQIRKKRLKETVVTTNSRNCWLLVPWIIYLQTGDIDTVIYYRIVEILCRDAYRSKWQLINKWRSLMWKRKISDHYCSINNRVFQRGQQPLGSSAVGGADDPWDGLFHWFWESPSLFLLGTTVVGKRAGHILT